MEKLLLPNSYKKVGWILLIPATVIGIILLIIGTDTIELKSKVFAIVSDKTFSEKEFFKFIETNIAGTVTAVFFIVGAMLVAFSREKNEDEFITRLRLDSLLWAVLVNYLLLLFAFVFIYGLFFLDIMLYNMFTVLIFFIARFNYLLWRNSKTASDEKPD